MLATVTHILPLTFVRRARMLPVPGLVTVRTGQKVNASDVIAQASLPLKHQLLDIRRGLGIPQISAAERAIVRQQGDQLEKGDVIAESQGVFARLVRAPAAGEIVSISGGQVLLRLQSSILELKAGFSGTVGDLIPDQGAFIETTGVLIQGAWGNGRMDSGMLVMLPKGQEEDLTRASLDVSLRGSVVVAGKCTSADALQAGSELPLRGLILSSMSANLVPVANKLNYPIIVVEGFGSIPMNEQAVRLLNSSEKRDASVNASFDPKIGERPEVIIPLPANAEAAMDSSHFAPNQTVRVVGAPYTGRIGTLVQIRKGLATLPNGLKAPAADVQLDSETRLVIPLANLEVLE
jgi:hypothetical protein